MTHQTVQMWHSCDHDITVGAIFMLIIRETISSCFVGDYNIDITVLKYYKLTEVFANWSTSFFDSLWRL